MTKQTDLSGSTIDDTADDQRYPGGETRESEYLYYESRCEDYPCPGQSSYSGHHQQMLCSIDGANEAERKLIEVATPDECPKCGGEIDTKRFEGQWPPEDPSTDDVLELFRESRGQIALEFYPKDRDLRFYIGEIGGRYCVEDDEYGTPDMPTGVDDLPSLVENHPNRLTSTDGTALEGTLESYQNGEL